jgi:regulator of sigma E protease
VLEKIGIFILFLGPLVFFHELGHYIFARIFGVRVEVFSIGFGPKIIKYVRKGTEYAISLIPLGGYVKMYGDDPLAKDEIPVSERKNSFTYKGKWARFWIVIGGPLANFLLAFVIFFFLIFGGEKVPEIKLGVIPTGSTLHEKGLRTGDILAKYNGRRLLHLGEMAMEGKNNISTITYNRDQTLKTIPLNLTGDDLFKDLVKYLPLLRKPVLVDTSGNKFFLSTKRESVTKDYSLDILAERFDIKRLYLFDHKGPFIKEIPISYNSREEFFTELSKLGLLPQDLVIKSVKMNSPADKVGLKAGDILFSFGPKTLNSFNGLRDVLQEVKGDDIPVKLWRDGKIVSYKIVPESIAENGTKRKVIGIYTDGQFFGLNFITLESPGFFPAISQGLFRTWDTTVKTFAGFKKLVTAEVSLKSIGGPLAIGKVASDSFNSGLTPFFLLMAFISINLGVINLLPIPVLDGGHIMFIILEILNRGPVSRKKMELAQQVGLSLLLLLMVGAIFNDFSRLF